MVVSGNFKVSCVAGSVRYCNLSRTAAFRYWATGVDGSSIGHVEGSETKEHSSESERPRKTHPGTMECSWVPYHFTPIERDVHPFGS